MINDHLVEPPGAGDKLDELTQLEFRGSRLGDVADYLTELHECRIELDPTADRDIRVTINSTARLQDVLTELLQPHGLVAAPLGERIVIGTPAAVQRLVAASDQSDAGPAWSGGLLLSGAMAVILAAVWHIRRGRSKRGERPTPESGAPFPLIGRSHPI